MDIKSKDGIGPCMKGQDRSASGVIVRCKMWTCLDNPVCQSIGQHLLRLKWLLSLRMAQMTTLLSISFGLRAVSLFLRLLTQIYFSVWKLGHGKTILGNPSILPFLALHEAYPLTTIAILGVYAQLQQIRLSFLIVHQFHWKNQSKKKKQTRLDCDRCLDDTVSARYRGVSGGTYRALFECVEKKIWNGKTILNFFCSWYIWYANHKPIDLCAWGEALLEVSCKMWRHTDVCTSPWHYVFSKCFL